MYDSRFPRYERDLTRWSRTLSVGERQELLEHLAHGGSDDVGRFLQNSMGERYRLLSEELAFVGLAFNDFPALIHRYMNDQPRVAFNLERSDQERFLSWLRHLRSLSPKQRDFIEYQQSEYNCLALARRARAAHLWFQRLRQDAAGRDTPHSARWRLNPIHVWSWLSAPRPDGSDLREHDVVFFAERQRILSLACLPEERKWLGVLELQVELTLVEWAARASADLGALSLAAAAWRIAGLIAPRGTTNQENSSADETFPAGLRSAC